MVFRCKTIVELPIEATKDFRHLKGAMSSSSISLEKKVWKRVKWVWPKFVNQHPVSFVRVLVKLLFRPIYRFSCLYQV